MRRTSSTCPPDVTAGIFWLKNRDPQHWRDSQQLEHVLGKYIISDQPMTEEQWARERATAFGVAAAGRDLGIHSHDWSRSYSEPIPPDLWLWIPNLPLRGNPE
jgi:hypothetical protein